jgi:hypothetical protein
MSAGWCLSMHAAKHQKKKRGKQERAHSPLPARFGPAIVTLIYFLSNRRVTNGRNGWKAVIEN